MITSFKQLYFSLLKLCGMINSKKIYAVLFGLISCIIIQSPIFAQGLINNGAKIVLTNGSNIYINGDYKSQSNGIITNDAGAVITLYGNWINNSSNYGFTNNGITVVLIGNSQNVGGTNPTTFYNLTGSGLGTSPISYDMTINNVLNLTSNQIFDINGKTLTIGGAISGSGKIKGSSSSNLIINGSGSFGTINFDQTNSSSRLLKDLTINRSSGTITLGNALEVAGTLTLTDGTLATGGNLKLVSNSSGTARISEIKGSGVITGNATIERYVPVSARRWRFISSNISNTTVEDWRGEIFITGAGTGTTVGTLNSNGFDATIANSASVYSYDESASGIMSYGWVAAASTSSSLMVGKGYRVFIRGDRSTLNRLNGVDNSQNEVTMNLTGTVNTGNISMPVTYTNHSLSNDDGWNFLGNPYPSQYDWYSFWNSGNSGNSGTNYSNIDPTVYVWDATSNSYKYFNALTNSGTITNGVLASGQGFMVKATGASPSMTFKEQFKTTGIPRQMFKSGTQDEMHINLSLDSIDYDDFILKYNDSASTKDDIYDVKKWSNPTVNISSFGSDSIMHILDARPSLSINDTVHLNITGSNGTFKLTVNALPDDGKYYFLQDLYLSNITQLYVGTVYSFTIQSSISASQGNSRFRIIISNTNSLPVLFGSFIAKKVDKQVQLNWNTLSEINNSRFEIERSNNNIGFSSLGIINAKGNSTNSISYNFIDEQPSFTSSNYYRIKQIDINENFKYSVVREVSFTTNIYSSKIKVYPNPAIDQLSILGEFNSKLCDIRVFSIEGTLVEEIQSATITNGVTQINVSKLHTGIYLINMKDELGNTFETKFIKE